MPSSLSTFWLPLHFFRMSILTCSLFAGVEGQAAIILSTHVLHLCCLDAGLFPIASSHFPSVFLAARFGGEETHEENRVHLGNAIMSFYAALIDLLGRCAPEMHVSINPHPLLPTAPGRKVPPLLKPVQFVQYSVQFPNNNHCPPSLA